ncbi:MAG: HEAT repeat domain-containing protein [Elusimicrobia bacterium]|nr:HEAT repeat domain-containing protein [Elusimicrobiota bacterium]
MRFFRALPLVVLAGCANIPRQAILREQDLRVADSAVLFEAAAASSAKTRKAAYLAMGRIQSQAYLQALLSGLSDRDVGVNEQAVFSLGQMGLAEPEVSSTTRLRAAAALAVFSSGVRGGLKQAAVEALGKTAGPEAEPRLLAYLKDEDPAVRGEAALALFRQRFLKRVPEYSSAAVEGLTALFKDSQPDVRWRAVYAFSRFPESRAAKALAEAAGDPYNSVRLFACRALAQLKTAAPWENLAKDLTDNDYLVRTEAARALGLAGRADYIDQKIFSDESAHVRAAAADALAATGNPKLAYWLDELINDDSPMVLGQTLLAWAKLRPNQALDALGRGARSENWWVRSRADEGLGAVPGGEALLKEAIKDKDARVASAALEALAKSSSTEVDDILDAVLRDPKASLELVGTAAEAAGERKSAALCQGLISLLQGETAHRYPELNDDATKALQEINSVHPSSCPSNWFNLFSQAAKMVAQSHIEPSPDLARLPAPATVVIETDKGDIALSLAADEAPLHAASFLRSVKRGLYDGTIWHRVVSGFVVQGGDPRGSGWGDAGFSLRDEINRLPFVRGSVGMPKAGKDTGGCQLFITHIPTPHLDGRYTVFGSVVSGMDVVDRLEPGDRIRRAHLK